MSLRMIAPGIVALVAMPMLLGCPADPDPGEGEGEAAPAYVDVSVEEAHGLVGSGIFVLDVRTPAEFDAGHIPGATNIDVNELEGRLDEILDRQAEDILVYCLSGGRSARASQLLAENGFTGIHNMLGGFTAWTGAGYESDPAG